MIRGPFRQNNPRAQKGAAAVEFSLVALMFFSLILGITEFGRLMFVLNTVQEVTRRAAREAVVRDFTSAAAIDAIQRGAIFKEGSTGTVDLPAGFEINNTRIRINYLNAALAPASPVPLDPADNLAACNDATRTASCIRFVEACVAVNNDCTGTLQYSPVVGLFSFLNIDIPLSRVIMPAESMGFYPSL